MLLDNTAKNKFYNTIMNKKQIGVLRIFLSLSLIEKMDAYTCGKGEVEMFLRYVKTYYAYKNS
jgi:hypothetical protein